MVIHLSLMITIQNETNLKLSLSTSSVDVFNPEETFIFADRLGYDGVEVMVSPGSKTQSSYALNSYIDRYQVPVTSIHAPTLLLCKFVWGTSPAGKLERSVKFAQEVGASKVVVHPPVKWNSYAEKFIEFSNSLEEEHGIKVCVENMFPWKFRGKEKQIYGPSWGEATEKASSLTFDFSHAAASSIDVLDEVKRNYKKMQIIHLCDGSNREYQKGDAILDEHLIPGQGDMPIREVYEFLNSVGWDNDTTLEVNTRGSKTNDAREDILRESIDFFRGL